MALLELADEEPATARPVGAAFPGLREANRRDKAERAAAGEAAAVARVTLRPAADMGARLRAPGPGRPRRRMASMRRGRPGGAPRGRRATA